MSAMLVSFRQFLSQISRDRMLIIIILFPVLMGLFFKLGIPRAEQLLCGHFDKTAVLSPYYLLFDIFLAAITPYMFCFTSAMIILEERDTGITRYLLVTPIGKSGYLLSRLVFPTAVSTVFSVIILFMFSLTNASVLASIMMSLFTLYRYFFNTDIFTKVTHLLIIT